jgi:DNA-binding PadR family transcriptional regulator
MATNDLSVLSYALLGLIRLRQPCSGYDLRGFFASQPMATFSDSPGSIYPALKRLEQSGMVRCALDETSLVRRRKLYRLSSNGEKAFERWLTLRINADDALLRLPELLLRLSFMEDCLGPRACKLFLKSLAVSLQECVTMLEEHLKSIELNCHVLPGWPCGAGSWGSSARWLGPGWHSTNTRTRVCREKPSVTPVRDGQGNDS